MTNEPSAPRSNVAPFERTHSTRANWTLLLIAAAFGGTLIMMTGATLALQSPPPPTETVETIVPVDSHHDEIEGLRTAAEAALNNGAWGICLANIAKADMLLTERPAPPDELRVRCVDLAVESSLGVARDAAREGQWARCTANLNQAANISGNPEVVPSALRKTCDDGPAKDEPAKGR
jgi:hypothetical protein